jgi:hypothetical protein
MPAGRAEKLTDSPSYTQVLTEAGHPACLRDIDYFSAEAPRGPASSAPRMKSDNNRCSQVLTLTLFVTAERNVRCSRCGSENPESLGSCQKCGTQLISKERRAAVERARNTWVEKLIDLSRRNRLLYFRDTKTGSVDITDCDPRILGDFLQGHEVTLSALLPRVDETSTLARAKEIRRTALANQEERGLETLFIAFGFASWPSSDGGRATEAPVMLAPVTFDKPKRDARVLRVRLAGDLQINPVLIFALEQEHGCPISLEALLSAKEASGEHPLPNPDIVYARLQRSTDTIKGFHVSPRSVLSNFAYQKMAMVKDLRDNLEQLVQQDLIAALSGDKDARQSMRSAGKEPNPRELDLVPPNNEFLVFNADSSQQLAIAGALSMNNGVIHGPPGTGKSQTIANVILELAARGRRILFVAEKRAALQVVLDRLQDHGLRHLALDLHGAGITRKSVMKDFAESLSFVRESVSVNSDELHSRFVDRRKRLNEHAARIHQLRPPSGLSAFQLQGRLLHFSPDEQSMVRWRGEELDRITPQAFGKASDLLTELGGFRELFLRTSSSEWNGAKLVDGVAVQEVIDALARLTHDCWPTLDSELDTLLSFCAVPRPDSVEELQSLLGMLHGIAQTLHDFESEIFTIDLEALKVALSPAVHRRSAIRAWCFDRKYRQAARQSRKLRRDGERSHAKLLKAVTMAAAQLHRWNAWACGVIPAVPPNLTACRSALNRTFAEVEKIASILNRGDLRRYPIKELHCLINALADDDATAYRLPRLLEIEARLSALGLDRLIQEIRKRRLV